MGTGYHSTGEWFQLYWLGFGGKLRTFFSVSFPLASSPFRLFIYSSIPTLSHFHSFPRFVSHHPYTTHLSTRYPRPPPRRRPRRALPLARHESHPQRVPRALLPPPHRRLPPRDRLRRPRSLPRRVSPFIPLSKTNRRALFPTKPKFKPGIPRPQIRNQR